VKFGLTINLISHPSHSYVYVYNRENNVLSGTENDVLEEVKTRIRPLEPEGGYVLAPANLVQMDIPPENSMSLFEAAR